MLRRPPRSTRTDTLFPYTTLFRSDSTVYLNIRHRLCDKRCRILLQWPSVHPANRPYGKQVLGLCRRTARRLGRLTPPTTLPPSPATWAWWIATAPLCRRLTGTRSEARRVGQECVSTVRSR